MVASRESQAPSVARSRWVATGHLTRVRAFSRRDVDRWQAWPPHPDPLYADHDPTPMTAPLRDAWYDDLLNRQRQLPFTVERLGGDVIGRLFLRQVRPAERTALLGIDLDPRYIGLGYGTDALLAFLPYFFRRVGFRRLGLTVAAFNLRARRSYERCGFRYVGSHWDTFKTPSDVFSDPRYDDIRSAFRPTSGGLQALMHDMVIE